MVEGDVAGRIGRGLVVLRGVRKGDGSGEIQYIADKVLGLRIFPDERHSMNVALDEVGGEILLVSQFTLYGDCRRGRRPSFDSAEDPERAEGVYREFAAYLADRGRTPQEGVFGAAMLLQLENDGPVTVMLDSEKAF